MSPISFRFVFVFYQLMAVYLPPPASASSASSSPSPPKGTAAHAPTGATAAKCAWIGAVGWIRGTVQVPCSAGHVVWIARPSRAAGHRSHTGRPGSIVTWHLVHLLSVCDRVPFDLGAATSMTNLPREGALATSSAASPQQGAYRPRHPQPPAQDDGPALQPSIAIGGTPLLRREHQGAMSFTAPGHRPLASGASAIKSRHLHHLLSPYTGDTTRSRSKSGLTSGSKPAAS
jgi:hypothetical protein